MLNIPNQISNFKQNLPPKICIYKQNLPKYVYKSKIYPNKYGQIDIHNQNHTTRFRETSDKNTWDFWPTKTQHIDPDNTYISRHKNLPLSRSITHTPAHYHVSACSEGHFGIKTLRNYVLFNLSRFSFYWGIGILVLLYFFHLSMLTFLCFRFFL